MGYNRYWKTMKMNYFAFTAIIIAAFVMTSCATIMSPDVEMPTAVNTINSVGLGDLNLKHGSDYIIMNTISADATVLYSTLKKGKKINVSEENGEFMIEWTLDNKSKKMYRSDYKGVARFGFLNNNNERMFTNVVSPENIVRNLATYRLINLAKVRGADGVIEPVFSNTTEDRGDLIVFKTTVTAKLMKLNPDVK